MKIVIIGAGAWGTALAVSAAANPLHQVVLCVRSADQLHHLQSHHQNPRYLPGIMLPVALAFASLDDYERPDGAVACADLIMIATPMSALRQMLARLRSVVCPVAWLCKGFEAPISGPIGLMGHEIQTQIAPCLSVGMLSGPSFAAELARGLPAALVAASVHAQVRQALVAAFHGPALRVYASDDIVGVEVGGAVKNVLAIAAGLCDGLGLGHNARAALITRGLAEMTRLGVVLGARSETFMGLSGLGDLVLTATGDLSRNRQVGLALAAGQTLTQAVTRPGAIIEGVYSARTVLQRAACLGVATPITQSVVAVLDGHITPQQAMASLMGRDPAPELG